MDLHLRGKRVLITGASKGIGAAAAEAFAEEGCDVMLAARNGEQLKALDRAAALGAPDRRDRPCRRPAQGRGHRQARQGRRRYRHPRQQCRRHPGRLDRQDRRGDLAPRLGAEGVRLHQPDPRDLRADEGARRRRHRQRHRCCRRKIRRQLHLRQRRQRRADGVHPRARRQEPRRQHPRGRHQSRPGRHRPPRHAA